MLAIKLHRDTWGRLVLTDAEGRSHAGLLPVRAFPLTDASGWISLLGPEGHEVMLIESPDQLPPDVREFLQTELAAMEFLPVILGIVSVSADSPPCQWEVDTNRGRTTFLLDSEDHLRRLGPKRVLVTDANGVRYDLPDRDAMDAHSLKLLRKFL